MWILAASTRADIVNQAFVVRFQKWAGCRFHNGIPILVHHQVFILEIGRSHPKILCNPSHICPCDNWWNTRAAASAFQTINFFEYIIMNFIGQDIQLFALLALQPLNNFQIFCLCLWLSLFPSLNQR